MKLRYLISLGYNCGASYQIRIGTGLAESMFFDWLYTSIEAATHLIDTDFVGFLARDRATITRNGTEVTVQPSGIRLNHSFKPDGRNVDAAVMERDFDHEAAKFDYLASKMRQAFDSGEPIGFVRYNPYADRPDPLPKVLALEAALARRLGHRRFCLYWVKNAPREETLRLSETLVSVEMIEQPQRSTSYRGKDFIRTDDIAWGAFLAGLDLDLCQRLKTPHRAHAEGAAPG